MNVLGDERLILQLWVMNVWGDERRGDECRTILHLHQMSPSNAFFVLDRMKGQTHFRDIQGVGNEKDILRLKNVFMATYFLISECAGQKRQIRFRDTLFLILLPFCLLAALIEPLCVYLYCLSMRWWQEWFVFPPRFIRIWRRSLKICQLKRGILMMILVLALTLTLIV